jgi:hypothetical protein
LHAFIFVNKRNRAWISSQHDIEIKGRLATSRLSVPGRVNEGVGLSSLIEERDSASVGKLKLANEMARLGVIALHYQQLVLLGFEIVVVDEKSLEFS